jgi:hypothetical protein
MVAMNDQNATLFIARDYDELRSRLLEISIEVPEHPKDRENIHVETYTLRAVIGSVPWDIACFPVEVERRERPDFCIRCNGAEIGLEHTEGTHPNIAKERALRADGHGPDMYFSKLVSIHDPVKTSREILTEILADDPGDGFCGDVVERNWAEAMAFVIIKKAARARKSGYERYGDDRLMIYDNWEAPGLKHHKAVPHLREQLAESDAFSIFRRVYVVDERTIVELSADKTLFHDVR